MQNEAGPSHYILQCNGSLRHFVAFLGQNCAQCVGALELRQHKNDLMESICMLAALFPTQYGLVKKRGNFKTDILVDSIESFLHCLS